MADSQFQQSFNSLNLGDNLPDTQSSHYASPPRPTGSSSLRSPPIITSDLPPPQSFSQQSPPGNNQSASARFERFFPSSPAVTTSQPSGLPYVGTNSMGSAAGLAVNGAFGSFGHNLAPGSMGASVAPFNSSTARKTTSRAALPSQWSGQAPATDASLSPSSASSPPSTTATGNYFPPQSGSGFMPVPGSGAIGFDDDVIPTAIVVKNIPFSVKKEQLIQIIEDLQIPMPYAFNYHFDQGVFRGLAFANFRTPEEADQVVAALNGFDVSGRKLRVEYKKVLQAGEKERIEKEKAIKRMQSMQLEKERERERRRQQEEYNANAYLMPGYAQPSHYDTMYSGDLHAVTVQDYDSLRAPLTADSLKALPNSTNGHATIGTPPSELSAGVATATKRDELDLNDPATLEIYSRVLLFKDDRMRDELAFSRSLSPLERRTVHLVAQKLGLYHYSMGEGDERYVVVTKNEVAAQNRPLRSQASTIGRSHRTEGYNSALLAPGCSATVGRTGLRMKKSAPDMKRNMYGEREGSSYANGFLAPSVSSLAARRSNTNLREGYSATVGRRSQVGATGGSASLQSLFSSPFDVPPVPLLPGSALDASNALNSNLLRQPRGPPTPGTSETRNFAVRSRVQVSNTAVGSLSPTNSNDIRLLVDYSPSSRSNGHLMMMPPALGDVDVTTHSPLEI